MALYTTYGHIRGQCGHWHQKKYTAWACMMRDWTACTDHGGYSDRNVYAVGPDGYLIHDDGSPVWPSHGRGCGAVKITGCK